MTRRPKPRAPLPVPTDDTLPPNSEEAEECAMGCVLWAGDETRGSQAEVDALLGQLSPRLFYHLQYATIWNAMVQLRNDGHVVNQFTLVQWLKDHKQLEQFGGAGLISRLLDSVAGFTMFPEFLRTLKDKALRRDILKRRERLGELAHAENCTTEQLREEMAELYDRTAQTSQPLIELITPEEARAFTPDPSSFLVGDGLITSDMFVGIGGEPGIGKSRLAVTLAVAGARGNGTWQGYPVRTRWRSLILQTENSGNRLKSEFDDVPRGANDYIKVSNKLRRGMAFGDADFRRELLRQYDAWPFGMLGIDPWNDVSSEDGQSEYKDALANIRMTFRDRVCPAIVIVAHLRKQRGDAGRGRKTGRELLHELNGSLALGSTLRTVFVVQPATKAMDDTRIVFEVAKANDCKPEWLQEHGTRTAWHRANGAFTAVDSFDWDEWDNPQVNEERRAIACEQLEEAFSGVSVLKPAAVARRLATACGVGESTVHRAIAKSGPGNYLRKFLRQDKEGLLSLA